MTTTTKRPDGELKPCPFCGSEAVISVSRDGDVCNVRCSKWEPGYCLGAGPNTYSELTAIAAWNARTPDPYRDAIDEALIVRHLGVAKGDAKAELEIVLAWEVSVALDPLVSSSAQALIDQGRSESPAPQAEASEHAPWSEDEEDAERLLACASRRKKYGDENCECDEDGSCVECEYDMQDVLKKRYAPLKHTTTPAPQPPVEGLREAFKEALRSKRDELISRGITDMTEGEITNEFADVLLAALASPSLTARVVDDDDPAADAKWQAGLDFAMEQFCHVLRVDPKDVNWDAATEELEGDVRSVTGHILRAKYGEDFDPKSPAPATLIEQSDSEKT